jgi:hypothetical protein
MAAPSSRWNDQVPAPKQQEREQADESSHTRLKTTRLFRSQTDNHYSPDVQSQEATCNPQAEMLRAVASELVVLAGAGSRQTSSPGGAGSSEDHFSHTIGTGGASHTILTKLKWPESIRLASAMRLLQSGATTQSPRRQSKGNKEKEYYSASSDSDDDAVAESQRPVHLLAFSQVESLFTILRPDLHHTKVKAATKRVLGTMVLTSPSTTGWVSRDAATANCVLAARVLLFPNIDGGGAFGAGRQKTRVSKHANRAEAAGLPGQVPSDLAHKEQKQQKDADEARVAADWGRPSGDVASFCSRTRLTPRVHWLWYLVEASHAFHIDKLQGWQRVTFLHERIEHLLNMLTQPDLQSDIVEPTHQAMKTLLEFQRQQQQQQIQKSQRHSLSPSSSYESGSDAILPILSASHVRRKTESLIDWILQQNLYLDQNSVDTLILSTLASTIQDAHMEVL